MKYLLTSLLVFSIFTANAQKIAQNEVDEFTGTHVVKTTWFRVTANMDALGYAAVFKVDSSWILGYKRIVSNVYGVHNQPMYLLFQNDPQAVELTSLSESEACRGCGVNGLVGSDVWGIRMLYAIPDELVERFRKEQIAKFKVVTKEKDIVEDFTTENRFPIALNIQKAFMIVAAEK